VRDFVRTGQRLRHLRGRAREARGH
jgi:hypothetical protein